MGKILSQSSDMKKEYCCTVVRIGEVTPIEGSDFLGQTLVNGFPIVVRKDHVKRGDVMFYVANECQLNEDFLRVNNLYEDRTMNSNPEIKGYFNKYGRVRIVKLRGVASMGFLFGFDEMSNWINDELPRHPEEGYDFDTVQGQLLVKAYVPPVKTCSNGHGSTGKRERHIRKFNRMIPGEFAFHYDTDQLEKNIHRFSPEDKVFISTKLHGTSAIYGNVKVREPRWGGLYEKYFNYLPKFLQFTNEHYDYVYSSRTVIKNSTFNPSVTPGYYDTDVWAEYHKIMKANNLLPFGMTVYGEIIGFTPKGACIQKGYDYGCKQGESKLMIYRITTNESGTLFEWEVPEIIEWTKKVVKDYPELEGKIIPLPLLYEGTLGDLYKLDPQNHWNERVLECLKEDKKLLGMEKNEPMCVNKVPREGVVIRKYKDPVKEAFKLKTFAFRFKEAQDVDEGNVDIEMEQAYC